MDDMNQELIENADKSYKHAEMRAAEYFQTLFTYVEKKAFIPILTKDIQSWRQNHIRRSSLFSFLSGGKKKSASDGYHSYIQWLNYTGKLENYLDRSFSYIFLRDLGKTLDSSVTQKKIQQVVSSVKQRLLSNMDNEAEPFSIVELYRWAQKENVEAAIIWLMDKLKKVSSILPQGMDADQAQRKLIKLIAGVMMHVIEEMDDNITAEERARQLDAAIRLGYSYGLTYPFIDDLLDANVLSKQEKQRYSNLIRTTLITGTVPSLGKWTGENGDFIRAVHSELREAFQYIKSQQHPKQRKGFFEQAFVFFQAQEVDRMKEISDATYTNEDLFIPVILKSSFSRLIARSVINAPEDEGFDNRTFLYGIYNQLADDFADMFHDMEAGAVTPYTYYLTYHRERPDLINPFELYWTVIANLIHNVYGSDTKTCEVMLNRAINGLKRFKERIGAEKYNDVMTLFTKGMPAFNQLIQKMVEKADDVDFFDKLLRDQILLNLKKERKEREEFFKQLKTVREQINHTLPIPNSENNSMDDPIIEAANYSLEGSGKRLRPIITWVIGVNEYGLSGEAIMPLLKSLEYMHTASLIFDDLPSQDNAKIRRGRPTLHQIYNSAVAELTGLFLTQKAIEEQASLNSFESEAVLRLIQYSVQVTAEMCRGQAMDLDSKGKQLTLEQLNTMCFYKTGIAFEASLVMPAILAKVDEEEIEALKNYARHLGIAFQIKDDLLDVEGSVSLLGKTPGKDEENHNATFVSILGVVGAKKAMWDHYCLAMEAVRNVSHNTTFLKHLMNYIVNRDN